MGMLLSLPLIAAGFWLVARARWNAAQDIAMKEGDA
jgi:hypothetical protein